MNPEKDMNPQTELYYRSLYEEECRKNDTLTEALADADSKIADLTFQLDRISNSKLWRCSAPVRFVWGHFTNLIRRI
ncbi:MAG: hypothetical protein J6Y57_10145, partial [Lachnospiraceae bacterium]|nr:hypothetical protein [Lachnospiraceae bacterium]